MFIHWSIIISFWNADENINDYSWEKNNTLTVMSLLVAYYCHVPGLTWNKNRIHKIRHVTTQRLICWFYLQPIWHVLLVRCQGQNYASNVKSFFWCNYPWWRHWCQFWAEVRWVYATTFINQKLINLPNKLGTCPDLANQFCFSKRKAGCNINGYHALQCHSRRIWL